MSSQLYFSLILAGLAFVTGLLLLRFRPRAGWLAYGFFFLAFAGLLAARRGAPINPPGLPPALAQRSTEEAAARGIRPLWSSQASPGRRALQPVLAGEGIRLGSWSPDGRYLLYSLPLGGQPGWGTRLYLYEAASGQSCRLGEDYPRAYGLDHAWLPENRLLYVDQDGRLFRLEACQPGHTALDEVIDEALLAEGEAEDDGQRPAWMATLPRQTLMAVDTQHGRAVILKHDRFWLLDASTGAVLPLDAVTPNTYRYQRDMAAFSPTGGRLALTRLHDSPAERGSQLYLFDPASGRVLLEHFLPHWSGDGAVWLEWLSENELLVSGRNILSILDLSQDPPAETQVLADGLQIHQSYPFDVTARAVMKDADGSTWIALRVDRLRDRGIYLYHPDSGRVEVFSGEEEALLVLPSGQAAWLLSGAGRERPPAQVRVLRPGQPPEEQVLIDLKDHAGSRSPDLSLGILAGRGLAVVGSSKGISLHDLVSGQQRVFYELRGGPPAPYLSLAADPEGTALAAGLGTVGLYRVPLPEE
jgi:hypothetical protein